MDEPLSADLPEHLTAVLNLIRNRTANTRKDLERATGLSRKIIAQRVDVLMKSGLVEDAELGESTGGRAPRQLEMRANAGSLLVAELNTTSVAAAIVRLDGTRLAHQTEIAEDLEDPVRAVALIERLFDEMLAELGDLPDVWGIGVGVILPVDRATGRPVQMPFLSGWGDYPIAEQLSTRFRVPAWVENEVNLMALGELRAGSGRGVSDFVFVKIGGGIGAGVVTGGELLLGAQGGAGEIGHVTVVDDPELRCWCGNTGCLMQVASGNAIARFGHDLATSGASSMLRRVLDERGEVLPADVVEAAERGDSSAQAIVLRAGEMVGKALATVVNIFNPESIFIGGTLTGRSDMMLAAIRRTIYERALPMSTRSLRIEFSPLSEDAGLQGAATMVVDHLFAPALLAEWIDLGSPVHLARQR